jgi:precorrin-2/cobalt-factor-2 C20-methyltransferase
MPAKLFGVGVGPGAPDLLTLRAIRILRGAEVLAIPRRSKWDRSIAWKIAEKEVGEVKGQERLFLEFPMSKDPEVLKPAWEIALAEIGKRLDRNRSVAFITEGDPFLYSTFIYLFYEAKRRWPQTPIEVVPGVSSVMAAAGVLGIPLADGAERVAILPASYSIEQMEEVLEKFDTIVLMKVSSVMPQVTRLLEEKGLMGQTVYISKCEMEGQNIVSDVSAIKNDKCDYFSMVLVVKRSRSGVLMNTVADWKS